MKQSWGVLSGYRCSLCFKMRSQSIEPEFEQTVGFLRGVCGETLWLFKAQSFSMWVLSPVKRFGKGSREANHPRIIIK